MSTSTAGQGNPVESQPGDFSPLGQSDPLQLQNDPETVYSDIYTEVVYCQETEPGFGDTLYGYCDWPSGISGSASCIQDGVSNGYGTTFRCKPGYSIGGDSGSLPNEVTLENDPEEIYSESVSCENVTEQNGMIYGDCGFSMFGSSSRECIEGRPALPFDNATNYLCKP